MPVESILEELAEASAPEGSTLLLFCCGMPGSCTLGSNLSINFSAFGYRYSQEITQRRRGKILPKAENRLFGIYIVDFGFNTNIES
jgi:hypothetical protein